MQTLWQDLRYGARMLLKKPGFTLVAVLTLALGIGANTAIFSVVNAVVLKPLPYPDSHRLVTITGANAMFRQEVVTPADFVAWRAQQQSFAALFTYTGAPANLTGGNRPVRVRGVTVSEGFFDVLQTRPAVGRAFTAEEHRWGRGQVAVISHAIWQVHFGGEQKVIGKTLRLDSESYNVVGVMPADFRFTQPADVITPFALDATSRANAFLRVIARLRDGVTREQARAETRLIAERLRQADVRPAQGSRRDDGNRLGADLTPLHELTRENSQRGLWILLGATAFVLLIACANLASLSLARAAARRREMAVRAALGAPARRLLRQALTESLLLAGLGGAG
ncbi:MAG: ABC transporter permease, partial [Blastocatellia bacterium]